MEDEQGYIDCPAEEDIEITTYIAKKYGCKMEVVSLHEEYWENVVSYTIDAVKRGLTPPNPDMMCNKMIKFGCFEQKWGGHEFDKIATGALCNDYRTWRKNMAFDSKRPCERPDLLSGGADRLYAGL